MTIAPLAMPGEAGSPVTSGRTKLLRLLDARRRVGEQRRDPLDGLRARQRERRVLGHVDRDPQRRLRAALADPDLEQPQPALLDRELDVAQVARSGAPAGSACVAQLGGDRGQPLVEDGDRLGPVRPGDDVLALGVEQDVAVQASARRSRGCA